MIQKYGQMTPLAGRVKREYITKAYPEGSPNCTQLAVITELDSYADEHPDFIAHARNMANVLRDAIFVDQVTSLNRYLSLVSLILPIGGLQLREPADSYATS